MCGIFGLIETRRFSLGLERLVAATHTLNHRGPDDWGVVAMLPRDCCWRELSDRHEQRVKILPCSSGLSVVLGHRRLSIIDLSAAGRQPMTDQKSGTWVTYNGEVYNFREIRDELAAQGVEFLTKTDTEVVLHAYRVWGPRCVDRFHGMFAFGMWNPAGQRLILARDRLGKKPLFYYHDNNCFAFASELKALLAVPGVGRRINPLAIHDYLTFGYVPGEQTILQDVWKVPPGHLLIWEDCKIRKEKYWDPEASFVGIRNFAVTEKVWYEETRHRLAECVKARLVSDVPMGAFLSGGIDSSAIVGFMAAYMGHGVKTFSIGFRESSFNELQYARVVARHFHTDHHEYIVDPRAADLLPDLVWYFDEPFADASMLPTYLLAQLAREHVKVALTGDGGDESFAGYESYLAEQYVDLYSRTPWVLRGAIEFLLARAPESSARTATLRRAKRFVEKAALPADRREWRLIFSNEVKSALYSPAMREAVSGADSLERRVQAFKIARHRDWVTRLQLWDFQVYLPDDLMVKTDRATMAHGLEARCPFLDHTLIERCAGMPPELKVRGWQTKYVLREALRGFIPNEILARRKQGFAVPVNAWFRSELREMVADVLLSPTSLARGYFRRDAVEGLFREHTHGTTDHGHKLWALVNLELWHRRFVDAPVVSPAMATSPAATDDPVSR
ncbi:MAG: asparagine synthase (glutamine-hydrolyzing) [Anaerolineae bacterium]